AGGPAGFPDALAGQRFLGSFHRGAGAFAASGAGPGAARAERGARSGHAVAADAAHHRGHVHRVVAGVGRAAGVQLGSALVGRGSAAGVELGRHAAAGRSHGSRRGAPDLVGAAGARADAFPAGGGRGGAGAGRAGPRAGARPAARLVLDDRRDHRGAGRELRRGGGAAGARGAAGPPFLGFVAAPAAAVGRWLDERAGADAGGAVGGWFRQRLGVGAASQPGPPGAGAAGGLLRCGRLLGGHRPGDAARGARRVVLAAGPAVAGVPPRAAGAGRGGAVARGPQGGPGNRGEGVAAGRFPAPLLALRAVAAGGCPGGERGADRAGPDAGRAAVGVVGLAARSRGGLLGGAGGFAAAHGVLGGPPAERGALPGDPR